jgi:2-keto-4-pentenoate hydratase/2-oxohepta-3-ene-1,7-dioic acid hydratase in catechol pathway
MYENINNLQNCSTLYNFAGNTKAMKILCVGRNYADHAKELNNDIPDNPVIFMKPDTAVLKPGDDFYIPDFSQNIHYECEIVYRISREGKNIQAPFAFSYLDSIGLGIDFTARDLQDEAKKKGLPWTLAKSFNYSAPISHFNPVKNYPNHKDLKFEFFVNGELRQQGHTAQMLFDIENLLVFISRYFHLKTGDLIYTGTPAGVGQVHPGDHLQGFLEGEKMLDLHVR